MTISRQMTVSWCLRNIRQGLNFLHLVEKSRIVAAGGYIEFGRVNGVFTSESFIIVSKYRASLGNLALARALGDFEYKKNYSIPPEAQIITANPEIIEHDMTEDDEFFVIACDGVYSSLSLCMSP